MLVRQLRLHKGWSQGQLAEFAGLSLRTIQRIEKGKKPTVESLKALASVFETDVASLKAGQHGELDESTLSAKELLELEHIRRVKDFMADLICFAISLPLLLLFGWIISSQTWTLWVAFGWAAWLLWEAFEVFDPKDFFGHGWERRQLEKRLGRKID